MPALRLDVGQSGRCAGGGQQGREAETIIASVVAAETRLMGGGSQGADVRIRVRHRPNLGNQQRGRGDQRDAKFEALREPGQ